MNAATPEALRRGWVLTCVFLWGVLAGMFPLSVSAAAPQWLGPARPEGRVTRVVTLAPSLTETLFALGREEALVAVSNWDDDPRVEALPRVGAADSISLEAIVGLRPQLVLAQPTGPTRSALRVLGELGIPVLLLPTETMDQTALSLRAAGRVVGAAAEGRRLARELEETRIALRAATRALPHPRVLLMVGRDPLVVAGPGSYLSDMLVDVGGINAADDAAKPWSTYPLERAVAGAPDVVLDGSRAGDRGRISDLQKLSGLEGSRWVAPPTSAMLRPGPSLTQGLRELAVLLHGPGVLEALPKAGKATTPKPEKAATTESERSPPSKPGQASTPDAEKARTPDRRKAAPRKSERSAPKSGPVRQGSAP